MRRYLFLAVAGLLSVGVLFGESTIDEKDFLFITPAAQSMYPETNYAANPSILNNIDDPFLLSNLNFQTVIDGSVKKRIDDSIGKINGTETDSYFKMVPDLDFTVFLPLEEEGVFGFSVDYKSEHEKAELVDLNYDNVSENLTTSANSDVFNAGTNLYLALPLADAMNIGGSIGYNFNYDPGVFRWVTDGTIAPVLKYVDMTAEPDNIDELTHSYTGTLGVSFPSDTVDLSFGAVYSGYYADRSREWVPADTDADGYKDSLYLLGDYYNLTADKGGPAVAVTGHIYENYAINNNVDVTASAAIKITDTFAVIMDGSYDVLNNTVSHYKKQVLTAAVLTDESYYDQIYDSGLGSFSALLGVDLKDPEAKTSLRIGAGYSRYAETYMQEGDSIAGLSLFHSLNPSHYSEVALGLNPVNGLISGNTDLYPSSKEIHGVNLNARFEIKSVGEFTLFFDLGVAGFHETKTYRVFNTDTQTVWEEQDVAAELSWKIDSLVGVAFPLGEDLICTIDLKNIVTTGDASLTDETHPLDVTLNRPSEDGTTYLLDENDLNIELNVGFTASW